MDAQLPSAVKPSSLECSLASSIAARFRDARSLPEGTSSVTSMAAWLLPNLRATADAHGDVAIDGVTKTTTPLLGSKLSAAHCRGTEKSHRAAAFSKVEHAVAERAACGKAGAASAGSERLVPTPVTGDGMLGHEAWAGTQAASGLDAAGGGEISAEGTPGADAMPTAMRSRRAKKGSNDGQATIISATVRLGELYSDSAQPYGAYRDGAKRPAMLKRRRGRAGTECVITSSQALTKECTRGPNDGWREPGLA